MSALKLTAQQVADDLTQANDFAESFGYGALVDGTISAEQYADDGTICATYSITVTVTETTEGTPR